MMHISYFNDHGVSWKEWGAFPLWLKIPILVVAPVFFYFLVGSLKTANHRQR